MFKASSVMELVCKFDLWAFYVVTYKELIMKTLINQEAELDKFDAPRFAPFWNEIVRNLREEDYISNA